MILEIILGLGDKFGNLFLFAFVISRIKAFKNIIARKPVNLTDRLILSIVFGVFGIIGTYFSVEFNGALVNTRIIGVATGGILGGPLVGFFAGTIAGVHRWFMPAGGFTASACAISTVFEGIMSGYIGKLAEGKKNKWLYATMAGAIAESMRKISVLIFSKPFAEALALVKIIWIPMVIVNSLGLALLFIIIDNVVRDRERIGAYQAQLTLDIADKTLPFLKQGMYSHSIDEVVRIIRSMTEFDAVSITDNSKVIAHDGIGSDHHKKGSSLFTMATQDVLNHGNMRILSTPDEIGCAFESCPLKSAIILPLEENKKIIGALKLYKAKSNAITTIDIELGSGLAKLFSTQLTLGRLEYNTSLLSAAELKALQAQINPHFLFNALAVISSLCRIKPEKARELINHMANYFRKNLNTNKAIVPLETEIDHVKSYVEIEKARFEEKLSVIYDIEDNIECYLPPLILQPVVENAIKHGLLPKKEGGVVYIHAYKGNYETIISVEDNGIGMNEEKIDSILMGEKLDSIGFYNVNRRLVTMFGEKYGLEIKSHFGTGTTVTLRIPSTQSNNWELLA